MRQAKDTDLFVELEGVGKFRFARRTFGDRIKIRSEMARLGGGSLSDDQDAMAEVTVVAVFKVLLVSAPSGWEDLESLDLVGNPDAEGQAWQLFAKLQEAEDRFRQGRNGTGQKGGEGTSQGDTVLVSPTVQPATQ